MLPGVLVKTKLLCMKGPRAQREKDSWTDMFLLPPDWAAPKSISNWVTRRSKARLPKRNRG